MLRGRVAADRSGFTPFVMVQVADANGEFSAVECVLDTGFTGYLKLGEQESPRFANAKFRDEPFDLADGSRVYGRRYEASVMVQDVVRHGLPVMVLGTFNLVGTAFLRGTHPCVEFEDAKNFEVTLPSNWLAAFQRPGS